jgi:hypothetical protein
VRSFQQQSTGAIRVQFTGPAHVANSHFAMGNALAVPAPQSQPSFEPATTRGSDSQPFLIPGAYRPPARNLLKSATLFPLRILAAVVAVPAIFLWCAVGALVLGDRESYS